MNELGDNAASRGGMAPPEVRMPSNSRYRGQIIDAASRRSLQIVGDDADPLLGPDERRCVVDYFFHEGEFWRADIPLDGVEQVVGQAFNFSQPKRRRTPEGAKVLFNKQGLPRRTIPVLNHLQSRFTMKPQQPIALHPLGSEDLSQAPRHQIQEFVYSLEAVGPPGVWFNLRDALSGNMVSAHRFLSIHEMVFERLVIEEQYITESPPLPLSDQEKRAVLTASLLRSHHAGMSEQYFLYWPFKTNNCTSSPLQIVDQVVKYRWPQWIGSLLYRLPLNPRFYLWVRGLDSDPSYRKLLRSEFESFINDPLVQARRSRLAASEGGEGANSSRAETPRD